VILLGSEGAKSTGLRLVERLAKAGLTAISVEIVPEWTAPALDAASGAVAEFAAELLEGRHPGLAAPHALGLLGGKKEALLAIAAAAKERRVASLVTWDVELPRSMDRGEAARLAEGVTARWLEVRSAKGSGSPISGGQREVRRASGEKEVMDAAVGWLAAMLIE
jgi:hypothetical protein